MPDDARPFAIFRRFLRFGMLAWGGPVAQIAMIKRELVDEAQWVSPGRFNRLLAVYQLLPGPEAHELCVHFGMLKGNRIGGLMAGLGFMLPGLLLVLVLAAAYQRLDLANPWVASAFLGVQAGVIALIVRSVHRIAGHALTDRWLVALAVASAAAAAAGVSFWIIITACGLAYHALSSRRFVVAALVGAQALAAAWLTHAPAVAVATVAKEPLEPSVWLLFLAGLKAGLLTFGGAYTAIPFVSEDTVGRGWVGEGQFLDALALSGVIPAPFIIFATFVGYLAGGVAGALAITAGIFLPAFAFGILLFDRLESLVESSRLHRLLEGVTAGVVGLIATTAFQLALHVAGQWEMLVPIAIIFLGALIAFYRWKSRLAVPAVMAACAAAGLALIAGRF